MNRGYSSGCFETRGLTTTPPNKSLHASRDSVFLNLLLKFNLAAIARPRELTRYAASM